MKKVKLLFLMSFLPLLGMGQESFIIEGTVKNVKLPAMGYVYYQDDGKLLKDSAVVTGDRFVIRGTVGAPLKAFVLLAQGGKKINYAPNPDQMGIYLESGTIKINTIDSLVNGRVSGTRLNDDQQAMVDALFGFKKTEASLNGAFAKANGNQSEINKIKTAYAEMSSKKSEAIEKFISSHLNSLVSLNLLRSSVNPAEDLSRAERLFGKLTSEVKNTKAAASYKRLILESKELAIGGTAPDFTLKNPSGTAISLSSFRGKYVLVDFWASWCIPCRKENPNVIKAYEQFNDKNFTVLGVSLDGGSNAKEKWEQAIAQDGLKWEQVSDLMGWNSTIAKQYKINSIPANFLIDPKGKIIARNLQGAELVKKLSQVL